jgi:hypothetical protein
MLIGSPNAIIAGSSGAGKSRFRRLVVTAAPTLQRAFGQERRTRLLLSKVRSPALDVEATTAIRQAEILAAKRMIERSMERFDLYPAKLMGDSAYGSAEMIGWLVTSMASSRM